MRFGYFDRRAREYVITDPRTPVKWINYLGTRRFGGFVDHTGGALLCKDDPTFNRITRYIQGLPASDFQGQTLYLRIKTSEGYLLCSPFFVPTLQPLDRFECRVGQGYNRWLAEAHGLRAEITAFVPPGAACEVRDIRITNLAPAPLQVDAVPVVEYSHPDALAQLTNADWVPQTMISRALDDGGLLIVLQYPFMNRDRQVNYLTSNLPASSFETDRKRFLGDNEYGTFARPLSLLQAELSSRDALRGDNLTALLHPLGALHPGEQRRLITQLGQASSLDAARDQIERFRQPGEVEAALAELGEFWDHYLAALQVETPDAGMNTMLNLHNPHQCYVTLTWSRYLSTYQPGLGARGIGIRDSSQDLMAVTASVPAEARRLLLTLLSFQRRDGSCMHQFNPLTGEASQGDAREMEDRPHYYSDDHLWLVLAAAAYLQEIGDLALLDEPVPFYDRDRSGAAQEIASVLEHLGRGLDFTRQDLGRHGLPRLGFADWNDTVNLPAGAESVFTAQLYGKALLEWADLMRHLGRAEQAADAEAAHAAMRARVEQAAWDGEWYVRYFDEAGAPLGSQANRHAQIDLLSQCWAVISGFASPERARQAMDSAHARLNTRFGLKLSAPGYDGCDPRVGGVTTYPPGAKENGGVFLHPNPWAMIAEAMLGNGERAHAYYAQINPAARNEAAELYECEPYVYAQNLLGDEHPQFGLARNSWLTGTASWAYQAATQWVLGLRPEYAGLRIDPCIPPAWDGFSARRCFRGKRLTLQVHNPQHVSRGVRRVTIDGRPHSGNLLPVDRIGLESRAEVWLGR
jgi:cellobiose phosphorylase